MAGEEEGLVRVAREEEGFMRVRVMCPRWIGERLLWNRGRVTAEELPVTIKHCIAVKRPKM